MTRCSSAARPPRSSRPSANTRGRRRGSATTSEPASCGAGNAVGHGRPDPRDLGRVGRAQEHQRHVQRGLRAPLAAPPAPPRRPTSTPPAATARRPAAPAPGTGASARLSLRPPTLAPRNSRSMCMATVVERSRTSARPPGTRMRARQLASVGVAHAPAHGAHGLLVAAAAGPGDAGDGHRHVHPVALDGARGHRGGHLGRDRPVALDQVRVHAQQARLGLVRVADGAAVRRRPTTRRARSAGPPAGRRCTIRPWRWSGPPAAPATWSSMLAPSVENSVSAWRCGDQLRQGGPGGLVGGLVADHHLDLAAAQARGHLEPLQARRSGPRRRAASRRSPTRGCRTAAASTPRSRARGPRARGPGRCPRPRATSTAARAAGRA